MGEEGDFPAGVGAAEEAEGGNPWTFFRKESPTKKLARREKRK